MNEPLENLQQEARHQISRTALKLLNHRDFAFLITNSTQNGLEGEKTTNNR